MSSAIMFLEIKETAKKFSWKKKKKPLYVRYMRGIFLTALYECLKILYVCFSKVPATQNSIKIRSSCL